MKMNRLHAALAVLLTATVTTPCLAQSQSQTSDQGDRQRGEQRRQQQRSQDRQRQQDADYRLDPQGWVGVAYDYDNDGSYEAFDSLYYFDLEQAKQRSRRRDRQGQDMRAGILQDRRRGMPQNMRQGRDPRRTQQGQRRGERIRLRGTVANMGVKGMTLGNDRGSDRDFRFAKVEHESGKTCRVMLGEEDKVSQLDIQEGDQITVEGVMAKVDGKDVLFAQRVSVGGDSITNRLPSRQNWLQLTGEIERIRRTNEQRDVRHTIVELAASDRQIDLGPENELQELELQEGDRISVLARSGRVAGQSLLIAQKIRASGQTIDVREATNRSLSLGSRDRSRR